MGDISYSVALADATRQMLDKREIEYDFYEDRGVFRFSMGLGEGQKLQGISIVIRIHEDAISSYSVVDMKADTASVGAVAEYITRANYGLLSGNFEMDYSDGEVRYKCYNYFEDQIPSDKELKSIAIGYGLMTWRRYGNGFLKVLFGGADPKDAIEEAERAEE